MNSNPSFTVIIVEDEPASQEYLSDLLSIHFPGLRLLGIEDSVATAVAAIDRHAPDLILLDVAIKSGSGFDVLEQIRYRTPQVIFTTAYDHYALEAFRHHAVDYLLKPLEEEKVIAAISRCQGNMRAQQRSADVQQLLEYLKRPTQQLRLPVSTMYGMEFIDTGDILFVEAEGNYSKLKLKNGKQLLMSKKIKELEEQLPSQNFLRIHHSYLANVYYIRQYFKGRGGHIVLDDGSSLPVSPSRKEDLMRLFHVRNQS